MNADGTSHLNAPVAGDITSLSDRLGLMLVVRLFMAAVVMLTAIALPQLTLHHSAVLAAQAYLGIAVCGELVHRLLSRVLNRRLLFLVNGMLIIDGIYVAIVPVSYTHLTLPTKRIV